MSMKSLIEIEGISVRLVGVFNIIKREVPGSNPGRAPKCSTRSNVCVVRCVCLRPELWDREQRL